MRKNAGVTLIEILLATIVMAIGLVGILALFPPAIQSSKTSMEEAQAALVAESIKHALTAACKNSTWDATLSVYKISLTHDLNDGGANRNRIDLALPKLSVTNAWTRYPGALSPPPNDPEPDKDPAFRMYADPWIRASVEWVKGTGQFSRAAGDWGDESDAYEQFQFSIDVRKINTLSYLAPVPTDIEKRTTLYEFRVHVFRGKKDTVYTGGEGTTIQLAGTESKDLISTMSFQVSVK
jgi:type II secretory pathway pseudopilin PulG